MAHITRHSVSLTGSTVGTTAYSPILNGRLLSIRYSSGGTISSTAVLTAANEGTDESVYVKAMGSAGVTVRPRTTVCQSTGRTIYNTTGTTNPVVEPFEFANERLRCSLTASTASGKTGTLKIAVEGN